MPFFGAFRAFLSQKIPLPSKESTSQAASKIIQELSKLSAENQDSGQQTMRFKHFLYRGDSSNDRSELLKFKISRCDTDASNQESVFVLTNGAKVRVSFKTGRIYWDGAEIDPEKIKFGLIPARKVVVLQDTSSEVKNPSKLAENSSRKVEASYVPRPKLDSTISESLEMQIPQAPKFLDPNKDAVPEFSDNSKTPPQKPKNRTQENILSASLLIQELLDKDESKTPKPNLKKSKTNKADSKPNTAVSSHEAEFDLSLLNEFLPQSHEVLPEVKEDDEIEILVPPPPPEPVLPLKPASTTPPLTKDLSPASLNSPTKLFELSLEECKKILEVEGLTLVSNPDKSEACIVAPDAETAAAFLAMQKSTQDDKKYKITIGYNPQDITQETNRIILALNQAKRDEVPEATKNLIREISKSGKDVHLSFSEYQPCFKDIIYNVKNPFTRLKRRLNAAEPISSEKRFRLDVDPQALYKRSENPMPSLEWIMSMVRPISKDGAVAKYFERRGISSEYQEAYEGKVFELLMPHYKLKYLPLGQFLEVVPGLDLKGAALKIKGKTYQIEADSKTTNGSRVLSLNGGQKFRIDGGSKQIFSLDGNPVTSEIFLIKARFPAKVIFYSVPDSAEASGERNVAYQATFLTPDGEKISDALGDRFGDLKRKTKVGFGYQTNGQHSLKSAKKALVIAQTEGWEDAAVLLKRNIQKSLAKTLSITPQELRIQVVRGSSGRPDATFAEVNDDKNPLTVLEFLDDDERNIGTAQDAIKAIRLHIENGRRCFVHIDPRGDLNQLLLSSRDERDVLKSLERMVEVTPENFRRLKQEKVNGHYPPFDLYFRMFYLEQKIHKTLSERIELADVYTQLGQRKEAIKQYEKCLSSSNNPREKANLYVKIGKVWLDSAKEILKETSVRPIELSKQDEESVKNTLQKVEESYSQAATADSLLNLDYERGVLGFYKKDFRFSILFLERSKNNHPGASYYLGKIAEKRGDFERALEHYKKSLTLYSDGTINASKIRAGMGNCYLSLQKTEDALDAYIQSIHDLNKVYGADNHGCGLDVVERIREICFSINAKLIHDHWLEKTQSIPQAHRIFRSMTLMDYIPASSVFDLDKKIGKTLVSLDFEACGKANEVPFLVSISTKDTHSGLVKTGSHYISPRDMADQKRAALEMRKMAEFIIREVGKDDQILVYDKEMEVGFFDEFIRKFPDLEPELSQRKKNIQDLQPIVSATNYIPLTTAIIAQGSINKGLTIEYRGDQYVVDDVVDSPSKVTIRTDSKQEFVVNKNTWEVRFDNEAVKKADTSVLVPSQRRRKISLKKALSVLLEVIYDTDISNGQQAKDEYEDVLRRANSVSESELEKLHNKEVAYCKMDTMSTLDLWDAVFKRAKLTGRLQLEQKAFEQNTKLEEGFEGHRDLLKQWDLNLAGWKEWFASNVDVDAQIQQKTALEREIEKLREWEKDQNLTNRDPEIESLLKKVCEKWGNSFAEWDQAIKTRLQQDHDNYVNLLKKWDSELIKWKKWFSSNFDFDAQSEQKTVLEGEIKKLREWEEYNSLDQDPEIGPLSKEVFQKWTSFFSELDQAQQDWESLGISPSKKDGRAIEAAIPKGESSMPKPITKAAAAKKIITTNQGLGVN